jgi:hypothetical protein
MRHANNPTDTQQFVGARRELRINGLANRLQGPRHNSEHARWPSHLSASQLIKINAAPDGRA